MKSFLQEHTFYNIMEQNTSFKGDEVSYINLLITNSKFSFMKANSFENGLSNHHHMIYTILKANLESLNQRNQCTAISNIMIVINLNWTFLIVCLPNCSTLKYLIVIPNHFGKHVNRTSQIKIVISKKMCYSERIKCFQTKGCRFSFQ